MSERIIGELQVEGPLSVRDLCQDLDEENDYRVRMTLRRLWKKEIILRTKQPFIVNERVHRGRKGSVNHT